MNRITKEIKTIANNHLQAKLEGKFDNPAVSTKQEIIEAIKEGKTFSALLDEIETRFVSITSIMMQRHFDHVTESYKRGIYKGFNILLGK